MDEPTGPTVVDSSTNCERIPGNLDCSNPPEGYSYQLINGQCYWCTDGTVESWEETSREVNLGYPHKDNLFYASTYIKTQHGLLPNYSGTADDKYAILRFTPDGGTTNNFLPDFPYDTLKTHEVLERNMYGAVQLEQNERQLKTRYEYSANTRLRYKFCVIKDDGTLVNTSSNVYVMNLTNTPVAITVGAGLPDSLTTHYRYHPDYSIDSIIDPNGKVLSYEYDIYGRLQNTYLNGDKTGNIKYSQWQNDHAKSFQNRMLENYVQTTTFNDTEGSEYVVARAYVDPLGRSAITATHKGSTPTDLVMAGGIDYDNWDRQERLYKPYMHSGDFSSFSYGMHVNESPAHAQNQYEDTPRSRVLKSAKYGININTSTRTVDNTYELITGSQAMSELGITSGSNEQLLLFPGTAADYRLMRTRVEDEDDKYAIEYTNAVGQKIATLRNDGTNDIVTLFHYDSQGRLVKVINPEDQNSSYTYNLLGQLYEKETVDNGITQYVYNKSGQITAEQDAKSAAENYIRIYKYDEFGRNTHQGRQTSVAGTGADVFGTFNAARSMHWDNPQAINAINLYSSAVPEKRFYYGDDFSATHASISSEAQAKLANLDNEKGQLTHSISYDDNGNAIEYRFMSYNDEGYLDWEISQFHASGITTTTQGATTIIEMPDYNLQGNLQVQNIDLSGDGALDFQYYYEYDEFNRLEEVYAGYFDNKQNGYKVASYTYDDALGLVNEVRYFASGNSTTLKNTEIDRIQHTYDVRDRLTDLNAGLFHWQMFYDGNNASGAQSPTTSWNGNINSTVGNYRFVGNTTNESDLGDFVTPTTYAYTYDDLNRLTAANAIGAMSGQPNLGDVTYDYDKIGNLKKLNRHILNAANNTVSQKNYDYVYQANTNRLLRVEAGANRYTYDSNGNMLSDTEKDLTNTQYGRANLPYQLDITGTQTNYHYNASDMRVYKKVEKLTVPTSIKQEYYLRDATGRELAVINDENIITWYVYGKECVAHTEHHKTLDMSALFEQDESDCGSSGGGVFPYDPNIGVINVSGIVKSGKIWAPEVTSDAVVQPTRDIEFQARDIITLGPGFSMEFPDLSSDPCIILEPAGNGPRGIFSLKIKDQAIPEFVYYLYDHLGNTRVTYSVEVKTPTQVEYTVQSATDYYPYGKALRSYGKERYQSTYHERDVESGFDYRGARFYDSDVARFNSLDPLAADYPEWSDYNYVLGNPNTYTDPDGKAAEDIIVATENQEFILENIHARTEARYTFNEDNELIRDNTVEQTSDAYSDAIDIAINSDEIMELQKGQLASWNGMKTDIDFAYGGGTTEPEVRGYIDKNAQDAHREVTVVTISGSSNPNILDTDGNSLTYTSADILLHEIIGHGLPMMGILGSGNAVINENFVRNAIGLKKRKNEKNHHE